MQILPNSTENASGGPVAKTPSRKYTSEQAARDAGARWWSVGRGLYKDLQTGTYYARFKIKGRPTFKSLETTSRTIADSAMAERNVDNVKARQAGLRVVADDAQFGKLAEELIRRWDASGMQAATLRTKKNHIKRIRDNWEAGTGHGKFDTFKAGNLSADSIADLRAYLRFKAPVGLGRGRARVKAAVKPDRHGYNSNTVNETIAVLRNLVEIAIQKGLTYRNPFLTKSIGRSNAGFKSSRRCPDLPDAETFARIFATMRLVDNECAEELGEHHQQEANAAADFAEFCLYSGARLMEAARFRIEDDNGDTIRIRGTKSLTSDRDVPVNRHLRALLNRVKGERKSGKLLAADACLGPLKRACKALKVKRLRTHDLRHGFATVCIESGVDIPTVSRWLGHSDGGALAMEVYGHLRQEHSIAMAKKVHFGPATEGHVTPFPGSDVQSKLA